MIFEETDFCSWLVKEQIAAPAPPSATAALAAPASLMGAGLLAAAAPFAVTAAASPPQPRSFASVAAVNSSSHPREYRAFQRACSGHLGNLAEAWASGGSRRMKTFAMQMEAGCNATGTEAMMATLAAKSKEVRWEAEYLGADAILRLLCFDNARAQAFMALKRTQEAGVILDPNDGAEKYLWATNQKSAAAIAQKETMALRSAAKPDAALASKMASLLSAPVVSAAAGGNCAATGQSRAAQDTGSRPTKVPPAKKAKMAPQAVLSVESDPRAYALMWCNGTMNDIGKGEVAVLRLAATDCQEELRGKLAASAHSLISKPWSWNPDACLEMIDLPFGRHRSCQI